MRGPASANWALGALLLLSAPACLGAAPPAPAVDIVPKPRIIERLGGGVPFSPGESAIRFALRDTADVVPAVDEICATAAALFGAPPAIGRAAKFTVWVGVPGTDAAFDKACRAGGVAPARRLGQEGYALRISRRSVLIAARSPRGAFYGLQSLNQLLRASHARRGILPLVRIIDWPVLRVRAVMDDISRGPVPNSAYMRQQIRRLAELKVNALTYYTEHVVATRSHPEFAPPDGAVSVDEWKAIAAFARRYHIDLIGNFQSFGHFDRILATPRYAPLAEGKSLLSPAFGESYRLLDDIYREMVPAFTAPWFHVNCDETFDLGRGASGRLVDSLGKGRVYLAHLMKLREMLKPLGMRMLVWGDMLLENPGVIDLLPRDVVIATWTYDSLADFRKFISPFQSRGFDVLVAPGILNSYSVMPNFRVALPNIARFVAEGIRQGVLGAMTTVWDDGGTAQFARDWYGVAYAAERMWSGDAA
ncbi:MAG TPA: glycoside hydrolase family 20 zincin-like fold domain-containing protein, partial [Bacteroidota bacterium]